jgi:hypothetical protein
MKSCRLYACSPAPDFLSTLAHKFVHYKSFSGYYKEKVFTNLRLTLLEKENRLIYCIETDLSLCMNLRVSSPVRPAAPHLSGLENGWKGVAI